MARPNKKSAKSAEKNDPSLPAVLPSVGALAPDAAAATVLDAPAPASPGRAAPASADSSLDALFAPGPGSEVAQLGAPGAGGGVMVDLDSFDLTALYALRQDIDARLPPRTLSDVDLVEELLLQYQIAKTLMASVLSSLGTPANQKAQVLNSCAAVLEQVTRTQTQLYNAERVKAMEAALEKTFMNVAQPLKTAFFERYEQLVREEAGRRRERKSQ